MASLPDPFVGTRIDGRFTVGERLGAGGMGAVYRAHQHSTGRDVAIKVIANEHAADPGTVQRFLREAKLASSLSHPNTVAVLDFGKTPEGVLFIVMELLRGRTLSEILKAEGTLSLARAGWIGVQLCDALEAAHRSSIVHRDLKPSNVLVLDDPPGRDLVKVLDFGLARSLAPGESPTISSQIVGTPRYMAPERLLGDPGDERADLFSLGVILYHALTGAHPYPAALIGLDQSPTPFGGAVPPVVENVILKLVHASPRGRFASAATTREALLAAMEQCAPGALSQIIARSVGSERDDASQRATRPIPARSRRWLAPAALFAIAVAYAGNRWIGGEDPSPTPVPSFASTPAMATVAPAAEIELEIRTRPDSQVRIDGVEAGRTPVVKRVPRSETPLVIELLRDGYRREIHEVVPDRARAMSWDLTPDPVPSSPTPPKATASPATMTSPLSPTTTPSESFIVPTPFR